MPFTDEELEVLLGRAPTPAPEPPVEAAAREARPTPARTDRNWVKDVYLRDSGEMTIQRELNKQLAARQADLILNLNLPPAQAYQQARQELEEAYPDRELEIDRDLSWSEAFERARAPRVLGQARFTAEEQKAARDAFERKGFRGGEGILTETHAGVPMESSEMYMLRQLGGFISAPGEELLATVYDYFRPTRRRIRRESTDKSITKPASDYVVRLLERIERGHGFRRDVQDTMLTEGVDPDSLLYKTLDKVAIAGEILLPWELVFAPIAKPIKLATKGKKFIDAITEIAPKTVKRDKIGEFFKGVRAGEADIGDHVADVVGASIAKGENVADKLSPIVKQAADDISGRVADQWGVPLNSFDEVMQVALRSVDNPESAQKYLQEVIAGRVKAQDPWEWQGQAGKFEGDVAKAAELQEGAQHVTGKKYVIVDAAGDILTPLRFKGQKQIPKMDLETAVTEFKRLKNPNARILADQTGRDVLTVYGSRGTKELESVVGRQIYDSPTAEARLARQGTLAPARTTTKAERDAIEKLVADEKFDFKDVTRRAGTKVVRPFATAAQRGEAENVVQTLFNRAMSGQAGVRLPANPAVQMAQDVARELGRTLARDRIGTTKLTPATGTTWLSPFEIRVLSTRVSDVFKDVGVDASALNRSGDSFKLSKKEASGLESLRVKYGGHPDVLGETVDIKVFERIVDRVKAEQGAAIARQRVSLAQNKGFARRLRTAFFESEAKKGLFARMFSAFATRFMRPEFMGLAPDVKNAMVTARKTIENTPSVVGREIRAFIRSGGNPREIHTLIKNVDYHLPTEKNIELMRIIKEKGVLTVDEFDALNRKVLDEDLPGSIANAEQYVIKLNDRISAHMKIFFRGRYWDLDGDTLDMRWASVKPDQDLIRRAYEEVFIQGREGEAFRAIDKSFPGPPAASFNDALIQFVMQVRTEEAFARVLNKLVDSNYAVKDQQVNDCIHHILADKDFYADRGASGELVANIPFPYAVTMQAMQYIRRMGLDEMPYSTKAMKSVAKGLAGEETVYLPQQFGDVITRARDLNLKPDAWIKEPTFFTRFVRWQKAGLTHGLFVPRFSYYLGNALGGVFMMYNRVGAKGVGKFLGAWAKHPGLNWNIVRGISRYGYKYIDNMQGALKTDNGLVYTADELVRLATDYGLATSYAREEIASNILSDVLPEARGNLKQWLTTYQEFLGEVASGMDSIFRVGIFTDLIKRGRSPEDAARVARDALYDYSDLTPFERNTMRKYVLFYSFMRKNIDANIITLLTKPERSFRQLRYFANQPEMWGVSELEMAGMNEGTAYRQIVWSEKEPEDGKGDWDPRVSKKLFMTTPMPLPEFFGLVSDIGNMLTNSLPQRSRRESMEQFFGNLNPIMEWGITQYTGRDLGTGMELDNYKMNEVPNWMMQAPLLGDTAQWIFGVRPRMINPKKDNPERAYEMDVPGGLGLWEAQTEAGRRHWALFKASPIGFEMTYSMVLADRLGALPWTDTAPRTGMDRLNELVSMAAPGKFVAVEEEVRDRIISREANRLKYETIDIQKRTPR